MILACRYQFSSPTIRHFEEISAAFSEIVTGASSCFWSDAFLGDRSMVVCGQLDPGTSRVFIHNTWVPHGRKAYHVGKYRDAKLGIKRAAKHLEAESNVVVSASKDLAKETTAILENSGPTMLICSETSDDVKAKLEDVNTFLKPYQHFVYTSAITVGTSYDKQGHFQNLLLYTSACSNNVRDSMQASMRVRHISSGNLFYGSYPRYHGSDRFNLMSRGRLKAVMDGREAHGALYRRENPDILFDLRAGLKDWQKSLWVFNTQENNVSAFLHEEMVDAYLLLCGYELMGRRESSVMEDVEAHVTAFDYHEIRDVSAQQQADLQKLIERGAASSNDKVRWLKGNFARNIVRDVAAIDPEIVAGMFQTYARKQMAIQIRLDNKRAERQPAEVDRLLSIFQDNTAQKLEAIRAITDMLGIQGSWEVGAQIERAVLAKSCQKVLEMRKDLQTTFDLRIRETKRRDSLKKGLELLNSVFRRWGYTEVMPEGPRKRAKVKGKSEDIRDFAVAESEQYRGFGRFT